MSYLKTCILTLGCHPGFYWAITDQNILNQLFSLPVSGTWGPLSEPLGSQGKELPLDCMEHSTCGLWAETALIILLHHEKSSLR